MENVSIFKATMDHIYMISRNVYERYINIAYPIIIATESSQKYHLRLVKSMKAGDREDFMKSMEKK